MTRTLAFQMSGPVPSPMMKGMIGWSGTWSLPFWMEILAPPAGGVTLGLVGEVAIVFAISRLFRGSKRAGMLSRWVWRRLRRRPRDRALGYNAVHHAQD